MKDLVYEIELRKLHEARSHSAHRHKRNVVIDKRCDACGRTFPTDDPHKIWCSRHCQTRINAASRATRVKEANAPKSVAPKGFDLITQYSELTEYSKAFAVGDINFLLLVGSPGSGKSRQLQSDLSKEKAQHTWIDNHATNLALYCTVFEAHNRPVVLDDVNHFLSNKQACSLLKALTQTESTRNVSWESSVKYLEEREIPRQYSTRSPMCLIGNTWNSKDADYAAIQDRSLPVAFYPSREAIHNRVIELGWCAKDIIDFIGENLAQIPQPSMREYYLAASYKRFAKDWRRKMLAMWTGSQQGAA